MLGQQMAADMDGPTYLKTIIAVAHADGSVLDKEREFIDMQAQLLALNPSQYWDHPEPDLSLPQRCEHVQTDLYDHNPGLHSVGIHRRGLRGDRKSKSQRHRLSARPEDIGC